MSDEEKQKMIAHCVRRIKILHKMGGYHEWHMVLGWKDGDEAFIAFHKLRRERMDYYRKGIRKLNKRGK